MLRGREFDELSDSQENLYFMKIFICGQTKNNKHITTDDSNIFPLVGFDCSLVTGDGTMDFVHPFRISFVYVGKDSETFLVREPQGTKIYFRCRKVPLNTGA
jgi:hypothetical protein